MIITLIPSFLFLITSSLLLGFLNITKFDYYKIINFSNKLTLFFSEFQGVFRIQDQKNSNLSHYSRQATNSLIMKN